MDRAHDYVSNKDNWKKNIIFDTNGMYNDMLNDSSTSYWCYRNKVKKTKFIKYSGKANCLCCGKNNILQKNYDYEYNSEADFYNERYENADAVICKNCNKLFECSICDSLNPALKYYYITINNEQRMVCQYCLDKIKICPDCGSLFLITDFNEGAYRIYGNIGIEPLYVRLKDIDEETMFRQITKGEYYHYTKIDEIKPLFTCGRCQDKHKKDFTLKTIYKDGEKFFKHNFNLSNRIYDINDPEIAKYFYENLDTYKLPKELD